VLPETGGKASIELGDDRFAEGRSVVVNRKHYLAIACVVLLAATFLAGYIPERRARTVAETESRALQERLALSEGRGRIADLLGEALAVSDAVSRQNYGQAQQLASTFFDRVRAEAASTSDAGFRDALNETLARRDAVIASLTLAEPRVADALQAIELRLRRALGYPVASSRDATAPAYRQAVT